MKRIVLYVLTLVMILSCVTVGASAAADGGVLSVETTQASVGSTVEVDLNITQNPGLVSIYLDMNYDTTRLELVEIKETGFVGEPNHNTDLTQVPYAITWDGGTLPSNVTATGTLATAVFKVKDNAPLGDAFVTVAEGAGGIINFDLADYILQQKLTHQKTKTHSETGQQQIFLKHICRRLLGAEA